MPAYQIRCSGAVGGAADHAFLSGYNDKAILGTYGIDVHPLQKETRERATGRGHGHAPEYRKDAGKFFYDQDTDRIKYKKKHQGIKYIYTY